MTMGSDETKNFNELWHDPAWQAGVNAWARRELDRQGIRMQGELRETQVRPWSIVLHVPTDHGTVYFKAPPPKFKYEMAVTEKLAQWFPDRVPAVLAVEPEHGWWLARDGGESIRAHLKATRDFTEWIQALEMYAGMQMELAAHTDELRALGVPDRRPRTLPAQYARVLRDTPILRIDLPRGITADEFAQLQALQAPLAEWCETLEASRIPNSLHHGDLNNGNVLKRDGQYAIVDWGDCALAHPFSSLRTVFVSVEIVLDLPDYDPATAPLRDAYLNAWSHYDSFQNLMTNFKLAHRLSSLVSTLSWYEGITNMAAADAVEYEHVVPELLKEFLYAGIEAYPFV